MVSQTTSREIDAKINGNIVTFKMHIDDARLILADLLDYEQVDSLLNAYEKQDSVNIAIINKQKLVIKTQSDDIADYKIQLGNYKSLMNNKDSELNILLERIEVLEKEVKKQRRQKRLAIIAAIVGPILTVVLILL